MLSQQYLFIGEKSSLEVSDNNESLSVETNLPNLINQTTSKDTNKDPDVHNDESPKLTNAESNNAEDINGVFIGGETSEEKKGSNCMHETDAKPDLNFSLDNIQQSHKVIEVTDGLPLTENELKQGNCEFTDEKITKTSSNSTEEKSSICHLTDTPSKNQLEEGSDKNIETLENLKSVDTNITLLEQNNPEIAEVNSILSAGSVDKDIPEFAQSKNVLNFSQKQGDFETSKDHENKLCDIETSKDHENKLYDFETSEDHENKLSDIETSKDHENKICDIETSKHHENKICDIETSEDHENKICDIETSKDHENKHSVIETSEDHENKLCDIETSEDHENKLCDIETSEDHENELCDIETSKDHENKHSIVVNADSECSENSFTTEDSDDEFITDVLKKDNPKDEREFSTGGFKENDTKSKLLSENVAKQETRSDQPYHGVQINITNHDNQVIKHPFLLLKQRC